MGRSRGLFQTTSRSAWSSTHRGGEIVLNDAYREMAAHYSATVLPGRVRKPKDKASVENNAVAPVATWIITGLRQCTFASQPV